MPKKKLTYFQRWYALNKSTLNARRKAKYANDPVYRQKAKDHAKRSRKPPPKVQLPGDYTCTLTEAAAMLTVTTTTLRKWINKKYLPKPKTFHKRLIFTNNQVDLMDKLRDFTTQKGSKTAMQSPEFQNLVSYIMVNWK